MFKQTLIATAGMAMLLTLAPTTAQAAPNSVAAIETRVLKSNNPQATFDALSDQEKFKLIEANQDDITTTVAQGPTVRTQPRTVSARDRRCWSHYAYYHIHILGGAVRIGWHHARLNWCWENGLFSGHMSDTDSDVTFPNVSFVDEKTSYNNVGWEFRGVTRFRYKFGYGDASITKSYCNQIRGGWYAVSIRGSCNLA